MDWSAGEYERTAELLRPAARVVVDAAAPRPGERVADLGCGTGNAALLAAAAGAIVTGVDPAPRLLEVARSRAQSAGLDVTFLPGTADAIPLADGSADAVISTFGVIFAPDAHAAVRELDRVTAPGGRIVLSDFPPGGPQAAVARAAMGELGRVLGPSLGAPPGEAPEPLSWYDESALRAAFGPRGFEVTQSQHTMPFTGASTEAYADGTVRHPIAASALARIEDPDQRATVIEAIKRRVIDILGTANEDPSAFKITVKYVVATIRRRMIT